MADRVAVLAHRKKRLHGGGLDALRAALEREGGTDARITVDGEVWYRGPASCVLLGNAQVVPGAITVCVPT